MGIEQLILQDVINVEALILDHTKELELNFEQLGFLLLFYRYTKKTKWLLPSSQQLAKDYNLKLEDVKKHQNFLLQKGYCEIESKTEGTTMIEYVNWTFLYKRLEGAKVSTNVGGEVSLKVDIVKLIEREFGRMLSPLEIELAGIWAQSYRYEDVVDAIKEAVISDVKNMKYIDKILLNWSQGGRRQQTRLASVEEVADDVQLDLYYNWLEDGEKQ